MHLPGDHFSAIWDGLPLEATSILALTAAAILAIIAWPHYRRRRQRRRWQKLPPPPVREELKAPELRLPRRSAGSRLVEH